MNQDELETAGWSSRSCTASIDKQQSDGDGSAKWPSVGATNIIATGYVLSAIFYLLSNHEHKSELRLCAIDVVNCEGPLPSVCGKSPDASIFQ
jgi:hypothetical protein